MAAALAHRVAEAPPGTPDYLACLALAAEALFRHGAGKSG